jgi:8-oxo-dGTP pyrophosphatase MutT (NUDIX family)
MVRFLEKYVWRPIWTWLRLSGLAPVRERAVCVAVRANGEGSVEVLLIKSARAMKHTSPTWVFPGGGIEAGETAVVAAHRELFEEAGVSGSCAKEIGRFMDTASWTRTHIFLINVEQQYEAWPEAEIGRKRRWFAVDELEQHVSHKPIHQNTLALLREEKLTAQGILNL